MRHIISCVLTLHLLCLILGDGVAWSSSNMGEAGDSESSPVDKLVFGSNVGSSSTAPNENKRVEQHLCACWCQGWAEIYIRQPTGL